MKNVSQELKFQIPLWQHQSEVLDSTWNKQEWALLLDLGVGKTAIAIATLRALFLHHKTVLRTLILTPACTLYNWEAEFKKHAGPTTLAEVQVLTGAIPNRIKLMCTKKILITNYEILDSEKAVQALKEFAPTCVVCDEGHRLKNHKSKRFKKLVSISDDARYRRLLTGTPILNSLMDVWAQWRFLDKGATFHHNFYNFRRQYFMDKNLGMPKATYFPNWQPIPGVERELQQRIAMTSTRKRKSECLDLPPLIKKQVFVELSKSQQKAYDEMKRDFITYVTEGACVAQIALTKVLRMLQILSGFAQLADDSTFTIDENPRLEVLKDLLEGLVTDHKVIVWCVFRQNYQAIEGVCKKLGVKSVNLTGEETAKQKSDNIEAFQTDDKVRVIIANPQAGGIGVNLTTSSYAIYYSRNYNLADRLQSEARNHRGGSEIHEKITLIDIVAKDTIDELVLDVLEKKENLAEKVLGIVSMIR